jgi:hypothetical protein
MLLRNRQAIRQESETKKKRKPDKSVREGERNHAPPWGAAAKKKNMAKKRPKDACNSESNAINKSTAEHDRSHCGSGAKNC